MQNHAFPRYIERRNIYKLNLNQDAKITKYSLCFLLVFLVAKVCWVEEKQARKSSEDAQAAGYAQFEKVWAWIEPLG